VSLAPGQSTTFEVIGYDEYNDTLTYNWKLNDFPLTANTSLVTLQNNNRLAIFTAGSEYPRTYHLSVEMSDGLNTVTRSWNIEVTDKVPQTEFNISSQYIEAGIENTLNLNISNERWLGIVDCAFSAQTSAGGLAGFSLEGSESTALAVKGDTEWNFESVNPGDNLSVPVVIFASTSLVGSSADVSFSVNYTDKYHISYQETFEVSLIIRGRLIIRIYDANISATQLRRNDKVSVKATLLNVGNINANFLNVSFINDMNYLTLTTSSKAYLGELEPDSPLPFSISARIYQWAQLGTIPIQCTIIYEDDLYNEYEIILTFEVEVLEAVSTQSGENGTGRDPLASLAELGVTFLLIAATVAIVVIIFLRYRKRA
ncbi:MAG: hypothetical protein ACFFBD_23970, partial [Candidatus Hodarchaeota archaeon]